MMIGTKFFHASGIRDMRLNDAAAVGFQRHHKTIQPFEKKSAFVSIVKCE
jgi:hypothetical protein